MPTYCVFLGHQPHISLAELCVLLPDLTVRKLWNQHIMTVEVGHTLDQEWLKSVGGTVLLARELTSLPGPTSSPPERLSRAGRAGIPASKGDKREERDGVAALERLIHPLLHREVAGGNKRKVTFSFRCFGVKRNIIRSLYRSSKGYLRSKGIPSRYIGNERHPAKPGTLLLRGIPGPGCSELVIVRDEQSGAVWIGATCAVQDIEAYTERDVGKPYRDLRSGILPPKLAQVMLNLGLLVLGQQKVPGSRNQASKGNLEPETWNPWNGVTVWDPFCGSGVIVLEALLRRAHVLASDRSERAMKGCEENIAWLRHREKTPKAVTHYVFKHNALKPLLDPLARRSLPASPFDRAQGTLRPEGGGGGGGKTLIVTETSLGPALTRPPTKAEVKQLVRHAGELERTFFTTLASTFPTLPIVASFPVYVTRDGARHFLPGILTSLTQLGYRLTFPGNTLIRMTDRHTLLYLRPDQYVGREIVCLLPVRRSSAKQSEVGAPRSSAKAKAKWREVGLPPRRPQSRRAGARKQHTR